MARRSFLVGRPDPFGRKNKGVKRGSRAFCNSDAGVWSSA